MPFAQNNILLMSNIPTYVNFNIVLTRQIWARNFDEVAHYLLEILTINTSK